MANTGIIQRRDTKYNLIKYKPLIGEIVFAVDTEEYGTTVAGLLVWKKFDDIVKSVAGKTGAITLDQNDVGLDQVDTTADVNKPLSDAAIAKWVEHLNNVNPHNLTKYDVGLDQVDNTADANKPITQDTQNALNGKLGVHDIAYDSQRIGGILATDLTIDTYDKTTIDNKLSIKANLENVYTRIELDGELALKADDEAVYTRANSDLLFEIKTSKGKPGGYAALDSNGKIPTDELYSNKEVEEFVNRLAFPSIGQANYLYVDKSNNAIYRFDTVTLQFESLNVPLGELPDTAYRGDRGKIAYEHSLLETNPHKITPEQISASRDDHTHVAPLTVSSADGSLILPEIDKLIIDTNSALKFIDSGNGTSTLSVTKPFEKFTDGISANKDIIANDTSTVIFKETNQIKPKFENNNSIGFVLNSFNFTSTIPATSFTITHNLSTYNIMVQIYTLNNGKWTYSIIPYSMTTKDIVEITLTLAKDIMVNIIPLGEII
jgi:hypothetical protein